MRRVVILTILIAGCSKATAPTTRSAQAKPYETSWKPDPNPEPKPPPPPPPAPPIPPPDPAAERRRAELAAQLEKQQQRRQREREFAAMPMVQRRKIELLNDAVKAKGLGSLSNIDLLLVKAYPFRFPTATPAELERALRRLRRPEGGRRAPRQPGHH